MVVVMMMMVEVMRGPLQLQRRPATAPEPESAELSAGTSPFLPLSEFIRTEISTSYSKLCSIVFTTHIFTPVQGCSLVFTSLNTLNYRTNEEKHTVLIQNLQHDVRSVKHRCCMVEEGNEQPDTRSTAADCPTPPER